MNNNQYNNQSINQTLFVLHFSYKEYVKIGTKKNLSLSNAKRVNTEENLEKKIHLIKGKPWKQIN